MAQPPGPRLAPPIRLPAEPTQARRFGKTRHEQASVVLEDYAD